MEIKYINNSGNSVDLNKYPYKMLLSDLIDGEWSYESSNNKIDSFYKKIQSRSLKIDSHRNSGQSARSVQANLVDLFEADVVQNKRGRIYVDDYYMPCNIIKDKKTLWETNVVVSSEFSLVTDYPYWIREKKITYERKQASDTGYLDYPYDYPYDYSPNDMAVYIENTEVMPADFKLVIQGPCENPQVTIGQNKCQIMTTLSSYEYIVLNSMDRTVYKVSSTGTVTNVFESLNRNYENFDRIPQGKHIISINGTFRMEIAMYMKRSEPRWT
ncbi:MAG: hypothetical protein SO181_13480 [Frisingicoccus sp.]|uniref:hypothetical protein n=1 Tax=Frisingicoccus sp. TaxID=1918627 RepID=UPI002A8183C8|nr:hypothetical protein [Frisingicoccus sp.]MDY4836121.1 hypothetical protein [Frisingicoccus sp.]